MAVEQAETSQALERYVAILDVLAGLRPDGQGVSDGRGAYGVADLSRALGLSKGTVSRYLQRLKEAGVLDRLADRRYALATRVYHWGQAAAPRADLRALARPVMEALAQRFGEPVSIFVLDADAAVCIDQVEGLHPVRLTAAVGRRLPLHTGSSPRLLLAFAPEAEREAFLARAPYPALTPDTITDGAVLRRAIAETQRAGYVVSEGESNEGVIGIAAPIRDGSGRVAAALSIAGPTNRLDGARRNEAVDGVRSAVDELSRSLGFLPAALVVGTDGAISAGGPP